MNLLLITATYPTPDAPNQGIFNFRLVSALSKSHHVRVIAPVPWTNRSIRDQAAAQDLNVAHPTFYYPPRVLRWTYGYWYWLSIRPTFRRLTQNFKPDVVLGYWAHPDGYAAIAAADSLGVPSAIMVGGSDVRLLARSGLRRRVIQSVLKRTRHVIAFSRDLADHVEALGVPRNQIDVVYRGVDRTIFFKGDRLAARKSLCQDANSILLLWVGRLVDVKNPGMAIEACIKWKQELGDKFKFAFLGDGPLRPSLERSVAKFGLKENVLFLGSQSQELLSNWFRAANLTILTSLSEGVPNVLLESAACGTPFVATDVGGVREIADPKRDRLVPSRDVQALQQAVLEKLAAPSMDSVEDSEYDIFGLSRRVVEILERL